MHLNKHCLWQIKSHYFRDSTCLQLGNWFLKHFHLWVRNCTHLSHWCSESKREKRLLSDYRQPHSFLWEFRRSHVHEKISIIGRWTCSRHFWKAQSWFNDVAREASSNWTSFLCFQLWVCVSPSVLCARFSLDLQSSHKFAARKSQSSRENHYF